MSRLFGIIFFLLSPLQVLGQTCLDSSVFPVNDQRQIFGPNLRSFITVNGAPTSVGIFSYNWASAELVAAVFKVLNNEIIGYNTNVVDKSGSTMRALYGLGGCTEPNSFASGYTGAGCGAEINQWHFAFEAWGGGNHAKMAVMEKELKHLSPENLGSLGYTGTESWYVAKQNYKAAWDNAGLALEFYKSYDAAWFDPAQFFAGTAVIPAGNLKNCRVNPALTVNNDSEMRSFLKYTNDTDGVEIVDGQMRAVCPDNGPWWYSPACRNNRSKCVPIISVGMGYSVGHFMQAAAAWNFPVAIATAKTWGAWESIPRQTGTMFYWWTPDTSFVDLEPVECQLPPHDALAYAAGDQRSQTARVDLSSWANNRLRNIAPEAVDLAERMKWNIDGASGINKAMMYQVANGITWDATACWWVQNFHEVWTNWIRDPTECLPGQGIVDASAGYLLSKSVSLPGGGIAVACEFCMQGTESKEIKDTNDSYIFVCSPCKQGYFQDGAGATECLHCPLGSFSGEEESTACERCVKGDYSDKLGSSVCNNCISPYTTTGSGSVSATDCVCPEEMYLNLSSVCVDCPPNMVCEEGSAESNIPRGAGPWCAIAGVPGTTTSMTTTGTTTSMTTRTFTATGDVRNNEILPLDADEAAPSSRLALFAAAGVIVSALLAAA